MIPTRQTKSPFVGHTTSGNATAPRPSHPINQNKRARKSDAGRLGRKLGSRLKRKRVGPVGRSPVLYVTRDSPKQVISACTNAHTRARNRLYAASVTSLLKCSKTSLVTGGLIRKPVNKMLVPLKPRRRRTLRKGIPYIKMVNFRTMGPIYYYRPNH